MFYRAVMVLVFYLIPKLQRYQLFKMKSVPKRNSVKQHGTIVIIHISGACRFHSDFIELLNLINTIVQRQFGVLKMLLPREHLHLVLQCPFSTSTFDDTKIMKIMPLPSQCERALNVFWCALGF